MQTRYQLRQGPVVMLRPARVSHTHPGRASIMSAGMAPRLWCSRYGLVKWPASGLGDMRPPSLSLGLTVAGAEGIEPPFRRFWRPAAEPVWLAPSGIQLS